MPVVSTLHLAPVIAFDGGMRGSVHGFLFAGEVAVVAAMDLNLADAPQRPISLGGGGKARPLVTPAAVGDDFGPGLWERLLLPVLAGQSLSLRRANDYKTARLYMVPAAAADLLATWAPGDPASASIADAAGQAMQDPAVSARFELSGVMTHLLHAWGEALKARKPGTAREVYYYWYEPSGHS
jgi:hypothetical protein